MNGLTRVFRNKVKNKAGISNTFLKPIIERKRNEVSAAAWGREEMLRERLTSAEFGGG